MGMNKSTLAELLTELSQWMDFENCEPVEWLVCGGAAMGLQDLIIRPTRDVDVLAHWNSASLEVNCVDDFPDAVKRCIQRVADNHPELEGLGARWVNLGPQPLARHGLPKGFETRLTTLQFGDKLTLKLLNRRDLLPLKLYAAADDRAARQDIHFRDIQTLKPTFEELDEAIEWVRSAPDFEEKRTELKNVIESLGHEDLSYYI